MINTQSDHDQINFDGLNVLVIGDVMLDSYLTGKVERISPEAPVPIVSLQKEHFSLGGAGNVVLNLKALGISPFLLAYAGKDKEGELLIRIMESLGLETSGILQSRNRRTTIKTRIWSGSQQLLRIDREDIHDLDNEEKDLLLAEVRRAILEKSIDIILLQDYNKGVLSSLVIPGILKEAHAAGIQVVVDPKEKNFWLYKKVDLFKPNLKEIQQQFGTLLSGPPNKLNLDQAAEELKKRLVVPNILITLSEKGIYFSSENGSGIITSKSKEVADVCGAGDTVVSVAALALAKGWPLIEIARLANLAGGQVCEQPGVVPVDIDLLRNDYQFMIKKMAKG